MTIAPIQCSIEVKAPPRRAFDLFTRQIGLWWPKGKTPGPGTHRDIVIEPHAGGRWFERNTEGHETQWGVVLAWEPPARLLLGWQLNTAWQHDPALLTEVELLFAATQGGGTRITLEHRDLERFGTDAATHADKLRGGWPTRLADFVDYVNARA